ncbi:hypothetical protein GGR58DRAFT_524458 [Xylaria digitata]|nr:hypothetical protein GGR58DRAFT_524458 [Xylaria digitata]
MLPYHQSSYFGEPMRNHTHNQPQLIPTSRNNDHIWLENNVQFDFTIEDVMFASMGSDLLDQNSLAGRDPCISDPPDLAAPPTSPIIFGAVASNLSWARDNSATSSVLGDEEAWTSGEFARESNSAVNSPQVGTSLSPPRSLRPHICTMCPNATTCFTHKKDLNRHINTVHATGNEPIYSCRCGKLNTRKDNYLRHLRSCDKQYPYPYYLCKCPSYCTSKEEHMRHVTNCHYGFGRTGRPSAS